MSFKSIYFIDFIEIALCSCPCSSQEQRTPTAGNYSHLASPDFVWFWNITDANRCHFWMSFGLGQGQEPLSLYCLQLVTVLNSFVCVKWIWKDITLISPSSPTNSLLIVIPGIPMAMMRTALFCHTASFQLSRLSRTSKFGDFYEYLPTSRLLTGSRKFAGSQVQSIAM